MRSGIAHGGRLIEARRLFPSAPEPFIDLSTGINPHAYPVGPIATDALARLPEAEDILRLQAVAAAAYGVADPGMVVATPGTQIAISLLPALLGCRRAVVLEPTYAEHRAAWENAGLPVEAAYGIEAFTQWALQPGTAAILCNPNNPDGRRLPVGRLLELAAEQASHGGMLVCDEAFVDLEPDLAGLGSSLPHPGLLVLRSFGKSYGLAGVRLGFVLASPERAARLRNAFGPWAISGVAIQAGCLALADPAWRAAMADRLRRAGADLDRLLQRHGLRCHGGTALFRLYGSSRASALHRHLGEAGLLVRRFDHDPGLLRFGLPGEAEAWARLEAALRSAPLP